MNRQEFIDLLASKLDNCPVLKSLAIAQACLESAFGTRSFYNNIYGIKCWNPDAYAGCRLGRTSEVIDGSYQHGLHLAFQTYHSIDDSIEDYCRLMNISRYKRVREATNYLEATIAIKNCGYATSLTYVESLRRIINQYDLTRYDEGIMQLTKNFTLSEFGNVPDKYIDNIKEVAIQLQKVRDLLGKPIIITSGYRTPAHNQAVGGASNSMHIYGKAADCHMSGVPLHKFLAYLIKYTDFNGYGIGNPLKRGGNLIHCDTRDKFTVWVY
jgi:uncharacterized protein YcbK (DUF882 family)